MKFEFRHDSSGPILFVYSLMNENGRKRIKKIIRENALINQMKKKLSLNLTPSLSTNQPLNNWASGVHVFLRLTIIIIKS